MQSVKHGCLRDANIKKKWNLSFLKYIRHISMALLAVQKQTKKGILDKFRQHLVLQCSELFYYKGCSEFLRQDSQSSYSFGKIQNVGETELSEEKKKCFIGQRFHISFSCIIFLLVLLLISSFQIHSLKLAQWFLLTLKH